MSRRFPVSSAIAAVLSVLLAGGDAVVASRFHATDTPGLLVAMFVLLIAAAQVIPFVMALACGMILRESPSRRRANTAIAITSLVGAPVFALGVAALLF